MIDWLPVWLTLKLALITTLILFTIGLPLAYWLCFSNSRMRPVIESIVAMPLVLPPVVLGFYLLLFFGRDSFMGTWIEKILGIELVFTFEGLIFASVIYSLPFMVNPLQSGFQSIHPSLIEASYTLGKNAWQTLWYIVLPNMKYAILTACVLSFAHTIGEFGVVLMIGGSLPGETKVASIAIYEEMQAMNYRQANAYALVLFSITFTILLAVYSLNKSWRKKIL